MNRHVLLRMSFGLARLGFVMFGDEFVVGETLHHFHGNNRGSVVGVFFVQK
jgi:hypothetical protein